MSEYNQIDQSLNDSQLDSIFGGIGQEDCGVTNEQFPRLGGCCALCTPSVGSSYAKLCPHLSTWSSLPDSISLEITHILECSKYGYYKRMKQNY